MTDNESLPAISDQRYRPVSRIADAERESTVRQLQLALSGGELDLAELDRRLAEVYTVRDPAQLRALTADLPIIAAEPVVLRTSSGSREKSGEWVVPSEIVVEATSGSITLDFTAALCPHAVVAVHVSVKSGSVTLIVPHGWRVDLDRVDTHNGSVRNLVTESALPGAPLLRVNGQVGSGSVRARYPKPPRRGFWARLFGRTANPS